MIFWRCRCGKRQVWESGMTPAKCAGCRECNTTLATGPSGHEESVPDHTPVVRRTVGGSDGPNAVYEYDECERCRARLSEKRLVLL